MAKFKLIFELTEKQSHRIYAALCDAEWFAKTELPKNSYRRSKRLREKWLKMHNAKYEKEK